MFTIQVISPTGEVEQTFNMIGEKKYSFSDDMIELAEMNLNMVRDEKGEILFEDKEGNICRRGLNFEQALEAGWKFRVTQYIDGVKFVSDLQEYPDEELWYEKFRRDDTNDGHRITLKLTEKGKKLL